MNILELAEIDNIHWQWFSDFKNMNFESLNISTSLFILGSIAVIYLGINILSWLANKVVNLIENLQKIGFNLITSKEINRKNKRKQQFCSALRSDLDSIAKAENWNDQWFTDLEAEIEIDGSYYNSTFEKIIRKKSTGIRREPSLIKAIHTSTERCMLLVGEPGSGKSIALRHLGRAIANEEVNKSKKSKIKIPMYINLKELPSTPDGIITSDLIKQFIWDHIRRGDADTAAYVIEHWQEYKEEGIWFFLFDSFDEIPAVLHAPNGSEHIANHSRALRHFMDGMGTCRSILASREYKGPEALPWHKLKIMPLNQTRQDELIDNTFLKSAEISKVRQHLAMSENPLIFGNPLFLSLLCRYVSQNKIGPSNDYDLLNHHLEYLAHRDQEYINKKYHLSPAEMVIGAKYISVLFAEKTHLSLAPTFDEIKGHFDQEKWSISTSLENLLSALIEVKIGRSDVKEARYGDRRFTFSHRRYQETFYVQYLAQNPNHINASELLLDSRWREFTVTLLQSQPLEIITKFAKIAVQELEAISKSVTHKLTVDSNSRNLKFYDWEANRLKHVLSLLNEGFNGRIQDVPNELREIIRSILLPIWEEGDVFDRLMIVQHGCLMTTIEYQLTLNWAVETGLDPFLLAGFNNSHYLGEFNEEFKSWIRNRISNQTFEAENKIEIYKLDALCNRLPLEVGAVTIYNRCTKLRKFTYKIWPTLLLTNALMEQMKIVNSIFPVEMKLQFDTKLKLIVQILSHTLLISLLIPSLLKYEPIWIPISFYALAMIIIYVLTGLIFRSEPKPINYQSILRGIFSKFRLLNKAFLHNLFFVTAFFGVIAGIVFLSYKYLGIYFATVFTISLLTFPIAFFSFINYRRNKNLENLIKSFPKFEKTTSNLLNFIRKANSAEEIHAAMLIKNSLQEFTFNEMKEIFRAVESRFNSVTVYSKMPYSRNRSLKNLENYLFSIVRY